MKKFLLSLMLMLSLSLIGCNKEPVNNSETQDPQKNTESQADTESQTNNDFTDSSETENETQVNTESEIESGIVKPLDSTIDLNNLTTGTYSAALDEGAFYVDKNGKNFVVVTVYDYELYEAADITNLTLGDTILILKEEVQVNSLETSPLGNIIVNGGFEMGGYDFTTRDDGLYYIIGASDTKNFYEIGLATLPLSDDFKFYDASDMDNPDAVYTTEDMLADETEFYYSFSQYNTTIVIEDGCITELHRMYNP